MGDTEGKPPVIYNHVTIHQGETSLDQLAIEDLLTAIVGNDMSNPDLVRSRKLIHSDVMTMAEDLAGKNPSPTEKMLGMAASIAWFALRHSETAYYREHLTLTVRQSDFHLRRIAHANRRFLGTVRTLAIVRRLIVPPAPTESKATRFQEERELEQMFKALGYQPIPGGPADRDHMLLNPPASWQIDDDHHHNGNGKPALESITKG